MNLAEIKARNERGCSIYPDEIRELIAEAEKVPGLEQKITDQKKVDDFHMERSAGIYPESTEASLEQLKTAYKVSTCECADCRAMWHLISEAEKVPDLSFKLESTEVDRDKWKARAAEEREKVSGLEAVNAPQWEHVMEKVGAYEIEQCGCPLCTAVQQEFLSSIPSTRAILRQQLDEARMTIQGLVAGGTWRRDDE